MKVKMFKSMSMDIEDQINVWLKDSDLHEEICFIEQDVCLRDGNALVVVSVFYEDDLIAGGIT